MPNHLKNKSENAGPKLKLGKKEKKKEIVCFVLEQNVLYDPYRKYSVVPWYSNDRNIMVLSKFHFFFWHSIYIVLISRLLKRMP